MDLQAHYVTVVLDIPQIHLAKTVPRSSRTVSLRQLSCFLLR